MTEVPTRLTFSTRADGVSFRYSNYFGLFYSWEDYSRLVQLLWLKLMEGETEMGLVTDEYVFGGSFTVLSVSWFVARSLFQWRSVGRVGER